MNARRHGAVVSGLELTPIDVGSTLSGMIRSTAVNLVVLIFGLALLGLAIALTVGHAFAPSSVQSPSEPVVFLAALGLWCTIGGILNLRRRRSAAGQTEPPLKSYVLVKWNVAILTASLVSTIIFFVLGNSAPDPGPLQRAFGIVMVCSVLSVPVVLGLYLIERTIARRKHRVG